MSRRYRPATLSFSFISLITALLVALAGCEQETEPVTAASSGYQAAGSSSSDSTSAPDSSADSTAHGQALSEDRDGVTDAIVPTQPPTQAQQQQLTAQQSGGFQLPDDLSEIPAGDNEALLDYFQRLTSYQPQVTSQAELIAAYQVLLPLQAETAGRVLEIPDLPEGIRNQALEVRLQALQSTALSFGEGQEELDALVESLLQSDVPQLAQRGQIAGYQELVLDLISKQSNNAQPALDKLVEVLEKVDPNAVNFSALANTTDYLRMYRLDEAVEQADSLIGAAFAESSDLKVAQAANHMLVMNEIPRLLESDGPAAAQRLVELTPRLLTGEELTGDQLEFASNVAQALEVTGYLDKSRELFQAVDEAREKHPEADPEGVYETSLSEALDRIDFLQSMIGKPLEIEGVLTDDSQFDWSQYRGQVVLVDFWATDCEPCVREIPTMLQLHDKHHADGFEVVGINLDKEPDSVKQILEQIGLPWPTVLPASPEQAGILTNPNAIRYHVDAIPFSLLVDREGNVAMVQARGTRLAQEIERLLAQDAPADDTEEPREEAAQAPESSDTSSHRRISAAATSFIAFTESVVADGPADSPPSAENDSAANDDEPAEEASSDEAGGDLDVFDETINPYLPREGLSRIELLEFILDMRDRPNTIQARPGFNAGVVAACDQFLDLDPHGRSFTLATSTRLFYLHRQSCRGDDEAQNRLLELAAQLVENMPEGSAEELTGQIEFYRIEGRALAADDLSPDQIAPLLDDLETFMQDRELGEEHLRLASQTVHAINLLPEEEREEYFQDFGKIWADSSESQLARYGKRIARTPSQSAVASQVGQTLEGAGVTLEGTALDLADYRGQVLVLDFWATWCGPCRAELPNVQAVYEQLHPLGLEIVGISLDESMPDLVAYLEENPLPWPTLAGEESQTIAEKYSVQGIPTMMLVDREGKIVAVAHGIEPLRDQIVALLEGDAGESETP